MPLSMEVHTLEGGVSASDVARQRRADTYGSVQHQPGRSRDSSRGAALTKVAAVLLTIGIVGGSTVATADPPSLPHGYAPAHADGWFSPESSDGTFTAADVSTGPVSTPQPHGYEPGRPDGWYVTEGLTVEVAGVVLSQATGYVPPNVR